MNNWFTHSATLHSFSQVWWRYVASLQILPPPNFSYSWTLWRHRSLRSRWEADMLRISFQRHNGRRRRRSWLVARYAHDSAQLTPMRNFGLFEHFVLNCNRPKHRIAAGHCAKFWRAIKRIKDRYKFKEN